MKILLISALVALALCQTRVVETAPAWNGWNGWNGNAWNGWNGWNNGWNWPATETVIETAAPVGWNNGWNPAWGNNWNPSWGWNQQWGARPVGWENWNYNPSWRWGAPVAANATASAATKK